MKALAGAVLLIANGIWAYGFGLADVWQALYSAVTTALGAGLITIEFIGFFSPRHRDGDCKGQMMAANVSIPPKPTTPPPPPPAPGPNGRR